MALKAAPEKQALLLDLQALDTRIAQLDHRAKSLPERAALEELQSSATALRSTLAEVTGVAENTQLELKRLEADVKVVEDRIARDADRLQGSSSVKDVAALEQELAALRARLNDLEEIELAVMERLEGEQEEVASVREQLDEISANITHTEASRDSALASISGDRDAALAARADLAGRIPEDLLALYEKQRSRYGTGASLLQRGVSQASGVALLEDELQSIRSAAPDDVLICPSSDAILVRTDESGL
ncbi:putative nucleic acid-binding Zn-ribbon protein [Microbacteriaceae bacterium SG_E_30_P1]|uniref:Nucleic acid-binding Zn-ribbon protein n=1 Tax=Antiquaquibacter oligotrophicus TaxID=2880260 RepID=A0ABT6KM41_9MICO|nr:hypothetical protein [Antiquaquibacter oligotrophicus]MDH6181087.1 putative nucleic acid-binding Zn-ribbon protein [Antiquaquibacter oligotrophicus]UDF13215.1 hypothetical protein LH407_13810 [Antiquaquibacter oligotrophicus]